MKEFNGVIFDMIEDVIIDRSPVLRATYAEAMADAKALVKVVNDEAEAIDDDRGYDGENSSIGRVDASFCFVAVDGQVVYSEMGVA